ncbi:MAG: hypothetical protein WKF76_04115 [Nocardioidaceae bacterium]
MTVAVIQIAVIGCRRTANQSARDNVTSATQRGSVATATTRKN